MELPLLVQILVVVAMTRKRWFSFLLLASVGSEGNGLLFNQKVVIFEGRCRLGFLVNGNQARVSQS